jgi:hypothetical protein
MPEFITIIREFVGCTKVTCHLKYRPLVHTLKALYFNWHVTGITEELPDDGDEFRHRNM